MGQFEVIVGSVTYDLSDYTNYITDTSDGFGMAPLHRLEERGPLQHGVSDYGFRLDPRTFIVNLFGMATSQGDFDTRRAEMVRIFGPRISPLKFRYTLDDGSVRQIDCQYVDGLAMPAARGRGWLQDAAVMLRAADPTWYDPTLVSVKFGLTGGGTGWAIPWAIPWAIGSSELDQVIVVSYTGSFITYPVIIINGPIDDPVITNETTGEKIDFTGVSLGSGESYTVDCRYGYKTVVDQANVNQIATLSDDSDLATFHLEVSPNGAASYNNSIRVTGSSTTNLTEVYFQYFRRYLSAWG